MTCGEHREELGLRKLEDLGGPREHGRSTRERGQVHQEEDRELSDIEDRGDIPDKRNVYKVYFKSTLTYVYIGGTWLG